MQCHIVPRYCSPPVNAIKLRAILIGYAPAFDAVFRRGGQPQGIAPTMVAPFF
ncbi:MAG: hypothetical protein ABFS56_19805 [Pseudomonadota bacterium]